MSLDAALSPEWVTLSTATAAHATAALTHDQDAALAPAGATDTPFTSAEDAVNRLLPYHVFEAPLPEPADEVHAKHAEHESIAIWSRFSALHTRYRRALVSDDGGNTRTQRASSMLLKLDHLAAEDERTLLSNEITTLTRTRGEYEQWIHANPRLRATMPSTLSTLSLKTANVPSLFAPTSAPSATPSLPTTSTATGPSAAAAPAWPKPPPKKRGRKSKTELAAAAAAAAAAGTAQNTPSPAGTPGAGPGVGAGNLPPFSASGAGMPQGVPMGFPGMMIPSFPGIGSNAPGATASPAERTAPFILQIPLTWLTRLTQAGIHPLPAPHLVPALSSGTQAGVRVGPETAPRPPAPDQKEAAVLVGMTQVVPPTSPSSPPVQILHVSIRWDKLTSQQLTTVINMLTSIQQAHSSPAGTAAGAGTAGSPPVPSAGMMMPRMGFQGPLMPMGVMPGFPFAPGVGASPAAGISPAASPAAMSPPPQPLPKSKAASPSPAQPPQ